ncbi:uncharacterized protein [Dermacentor andersoni]|uniref:uncharacterized protein n=1 Tax=Dermacentor andersoni TaxID=34620 RepID=UPI002415998A|nr:uncharacterized protein LOC129384585 [Dermacentor andersoni]
MGTTDYKSKIQTSMDHRAWRLCWHDELKPICFCHTGGTQLYHCSAAEIANSSGFATAVSQHVGRTQALQRSHLTCRHTNIVFGLFQVHFLLLHSEKKGMTLAALGTNDDVPCVRPEMKKLCCLMHGSTGFFLSKTNMADCKQAKRCTWL